MKSMKIKNVLAVILASLMIGFFVGYSFSYHHNKQAEKSLQIKAQKGY